MADIFNEVFVNTAKKVNEKIPRTKKSPSDYLSSKNAECFFISPVTPHEIKSIINSMKSGKAVGPYSIPIFLLKILREHTVGPYSIPIFLLKILREHTVGPYSIPIFLLKILCEHIAIHLCDIINNSFSNGLFPDMLKLAKIIPLYKKDSPEVAPVIDPFLYCQFLVRSLRN